MFLIHGNTVTYVVLYTQCLRYNICSVWFLDIRISTCYHMLAGCETPSEFAGRGKKTAWDTWNIATSYLNYIKIITV